MWRRLTLTVVAGLLLSVSGCGGSPSVPTPGGVRGPTSTSTGHVASLPSGSAVAEALDVESGVTALSIRTGTVAGQLASAATPDGSGQRPVLRAAGGVVTLTLASTAAGGTSSTVGVVLARSVIWTINLDGGATSETVDMRDGRIAAIVLTAGVTRASIDLPARSGTELVREVGGASELTVTVPATTASRVRVGGGASQVRLGATTHTGVAGGQVFTTAGFAHAPQRLDLELVGGVSSVVVANTP